MTGLEGGGDSMLKRDAGDFGWGRDDVRYGVLDGPIHANDSCRFLCGPFPVPRHFEALVISARRLKNWRLRGLLMVRLAGTDW